MAWDDPNIYYHPEKFNLEVLAEIEYSSGSYEFDTRVVWRNKTTGVLYTARDAGCSCPTPFEGLTMETLEPLTDLEALKKEVYCKGDDYNSYFQDGSEFLMKIERHLNEL